MKMVSESYKILDDELHKLAEPFFKKIGALAKKGLFEGNLDFSWFQDDVIYVNIPVKFTDIELDGELSREYSITLEIKAEVVNCDGD